MSIKTDAQRCEDAPVARNRTRALRRRIKPASVLRLEAVAVTFMEGGEDNATGGGEVAAVRLQQRDG